MESDGEFVEVLVERDFSVGNEPTRFRRVYPEELRDRVSEADFLRIVDYINDLFSEAERVGCRTFAESFFGCLSLFTLFLCYEPHYKKEARRLQEYLVQENRDVLLPHGVRLFNPIHNGLQFLEFHVYRR